MKKLLTIVDDWEKQERYEERLSSRYEVHGAPFGQYGVQMAREETPPFDLILVDLVLEDMRDDEAWTQLQADARTRDVPAVFISDPETTLPAPARRLTRPYEFAGLLELLENALKS